MSLTVKRLTGAVYALISPSTLAVYNSKALPIRADMEQFADEVIWGSTSLIRSVISAVLGVVNDTLRES